MLATEVRDPGVGLVTVTRTKVTGDLSLARIYWTIIEDRAPQLKRAQDEEQTLRVAFENKQRKAANYDAYKAQLAQMEAGAWERDIEIAEVGSGLVVVHCFGRLK